MIIPFKSFILCIYVLSIFLFSCFLNLRLFFDYIFHSNPVSQQYDYIIVGSGSAGSIVAKRLSEDKTESVLVLEAGSSRFNLLDIPPIGLMLQNSAFDWKYKTVPQKQACLGLENQMSSWPMGKLVGGTSNLNNLVYMRGNPNDYAEWYKNNKNFNYNSDIFTYFKKLETSIEISDLPFISPLSDSFHEAGKYLGFNEHDGLTGTTGFAKPKANLQNGARWTSSHILPRKTRPNLVIQTNSLVEQILFRANFEAYGLLYTKFGQKHLVKAKKGIVLCAGTIGTPKILLLSGVGPKNHLKNLNIPLKIALENVGEGLQDHLASGLDLVLLNTSLNMEIDQMMHPSAIFQYFWKNSGPWTTIGCENIAFFNTKPGKVPDLQFMVLPLGVTSDKGAFLAGLAGIGKDIIDNYFNRINQTSITILPIVLHPKSRGTVRLQSNNPQDAPLIDPNYLSHPDDVKIMIKGIALIKRLINTPAMAKLGAKLNKIHFPGCEKLVFDTEEYWECYLRHLSITSYHPVGTCAMGKVVDFDFKVLGSNNLFVVDGSVLPTLTSGNPNGAIMMLAEKAADSIKNQRYLMLGKSEVRNIFIRDNKCKVEM